MTVSGYGYQAWGTSPFGGLTVGVIDFVRAFAAGDRIVLVELNYEPQHLGAQYPGDALNPASWTVVGPGRPGGDGSYRTPRPLRPRGAAPRRGAGQAGRFGGDGDRRESRRGLRG